MDLVSKVTMQDRKECSQLFYFLRTEPMCKFPAKENSVNYTFIRACDVSGDYSGSVNKRLIITFSELEGT
jgi:hypothetical protein